MKFILVLLLGVAAGLAYGWLISPVEYVDTSPATLSADYHTDYVLMTAEIYAASVDLDAAVRSLALLSPQSPVITVTEAYEYAQANSYAQPDIAILEYLLNALRSWEAGGSS